MASNGSPQLRMSIAFGRKSLTFAALGTSTPSGVYTTLGSTSKLPRRNAPVAVESKSATSLRPSRASNTGGTQSAFPFT